MKAYFDKGKPFWGKFSVGIDPGINNVLVSSVNKKNKIMVYKLSVVNVYDKIYCVSIE